MPYTDPVMTFAAGTKLTAAQLNTYLRDNQGFLARPPMCSVFHNVAQSVANSTLTVLSANSENFDTDTMHSTVTNNSRITIQTAGRYLLATTVFFDVDADGSRFIEFMVNGATRYNVSQTASAGASQETILSGVRTLELAVADYVEVRCRHIAGATLDVTLNEFAATFLGLG